MEPPCEGKMSLRKKNKPAKLESYDDIDEAIEGRRTYNVKAKLSPSLYQEAYVEERCGEDVSYKTFQQRGFDQPILVEKKDGLGVEVPGSDFSVRDVMGHVGDDCPIEVINTVTQSSESWSMERFVQYYETSKSKRTKIWNVISLEFSATTLDPLVISPSVVREIDWAQKAWPLDLMYVDVEQISNHEELTFPKVLKYCLMSVAGCYTDFHIDLGGTSVWYHILKGQKVFWLIPPTVENLQAYVDWSMSGEQEQTFLADKCTGCQRITLSKGNTFFIPTGWIHAVYTPTDSLVFGGNFLHSYNVGLQLRVVAIEEKLRVGLKYRYPFFHEMQWYLYDHYNIALTGESFMLSSEDQRVSEWCDIVEANPVLSKYELQGLKNLREWLPNQDADTFPDAELAIDGARQGLLDSMLIAIAKHGEDETKTPCPLDHSILQWNKEVLDNYKSIWSLSLTAITENKTKTQNTDDTPPKKKLRSTEWLPTSSHQRPGLRRHKCGHCPACLCIDDCNKCIYCKDMRKYGGTGKMKQACIERKCVMLSANSFKIDALNDPKQRKLTSANFTVKSEPKAKVKAVESTKGSLADKPKIKEEPTSPAKGSLNTPRKRKTEMEETAENDSEKSMQQTKLTHFIASNKSKKTSSKDVHKEKDGPSKPTKLAKSVKSLSEEFGEGNYMSGKDVSAEKFGYSQAYLERLLDNADANRLDINGDIIFYRKKVGGGIRVFLRNSGNDVSINADQIKSAVIDGAIKSLICKDKTILKSPEKSPSKKKVKLSKSVVEDKRSKDVVSKKESEDVKTKSTDSTKSNSIDSRDKSTDSAKTTSKYLSADTEEGSEKLSAADKSSVAGVIGGHVDDKNLGVFGEVADGAAVVKNIIGFMASSARESKVSGFKSSLKMVFLCSSQAVDEDCKVIYVGHVMAVVEETYLHKMSLKPGCKHVKVQIPSMSINLPLVFPKPSDLSKCQSIEAKPFMVEEDESAAYVGHSLVDNTGSFSVTSPPKPSSENSNIEHLEDKSIITRDMQGQGVSASLNLQPKMAKKEITTTVIEERIVSEIPSVDNFVTVKGPDNEIHRVQVASDDKLLTREQVIQCVIKAGFTPVTSAESAESLSVESNTTSEIGLGVSNSCNTTNTECNKDSTDPPVLIGDIKSMSVNLMTDDLAESRSQLFGFSEDSIPEDGGSESTKMLVDDMIVVEQAENLESPEEPPFIEQPSIAPIRAGGLRSLLPKKIITESSPTLSHYFTIAAGDKRNNIGKDSDTAEEIVKDKMKASNIVMTKAGKTKSNIAGKRLKKKLRRNACGECENCTRDNCRVCTACKDMKKYGGAGRLKQKCFKKKCYNMGNTNVSTPAEDNTKYTIMHLEQIDVPNTEEVTLFVQTDEHADVSNDTLTKEKVEIQTPKAKEAADERAVAKLDKSNYQDVIKAEAAIVRKMPNCGDCTMCLDKKEFGGNNKKKQMCLIKKDELKQRLAKLEQAEREEGDSSDNSPEKLRSRTSSRRRRLTQKMEESMDQAWHESVSLNIHELSDYASSLLDNYLDTLHCDENATEDDESADESVLSETAVGDKVIIDESEEYELNEILMSQLMEEMDEPGKHIQGVSADVNKPGPSKSNIEADPLSKPSDDSELPLYEEILLPVFRYLPRADLLNCALVCQSWYAAHRDPSLWRVIDLTKRAIDESASESVVSLQPEVLTMNKAITSTQALQTLLSGLVYCTELSMKGVTAVAKLGLNYIPPSVNNLNISGISTLTDTVFATMFSRDAVSVRSYADNMLYLDISNTDIGDQTLRLIAKHLSQLSSLNVNACSRITNAGLFSLSLSKRLAIEEIEMNDCEGIDSGCLQALDSEKKLCTLRSINFNGCPNISLIDIKNFVNVEKAKGHTSWKFSRKHLQQRDL